VESNVIGSLIRDRRRRLGLTQNELSQAAGVSRELISKLERIGGQAPHWPQLKRIERALEYPDGALTAAAGYDGQLIPAKRRTLRDLARELLALAEELEGYGGDALPSVWRELSLAGPRLST